jgi:Cytochrome c, mono- and diheme variants
MSRNKLLWTVITGIMLLSVGCRYDMQDQPRYKAYKKSDWFADGRASRELPEGTVARGLLRDDKAFYTGRTGDASQQQPVQTTTDASGNTIVTSFPGLVDEFPVPVTKELIDRGQERYNIYCMVCHGPTGNGDGMIVRRGFPKPPTYNDDRLRNAPVGHFFDVITNGFGRMSSYASQIPVADRWAIVAYIRALQISQNPTGMKPLPTASPDAARPNANANTANNNTAPVSAPTSANTNTNGQGGTR